MHAYSWVITSVEAAGDIPSAEEITAACLSMESILDDPKQERIGWYVIGGRWTGWLARELANTTPLPHDMQNPWWKDVPGNVTVVKHVDAAKVRWPAEIFSPDQRLLLMRHHYDIFHPPDPDKIPLAHTLLTKYPNHIMMAIDIHD